MTDQSGRSAIGGTSTLGAQQSGNVNYSVMPEQASKQFSGQGEFIVIHQARQGEQPTIWSSGDPQQTQTLFKQVTGLLQPTS